jgi:hypothetical protein
MSNEWISLKSVIDKINQMSPHTWTRDWGLKYINIRIDTRDMHCLIFSDREGEPLTLDRIQIAINKAEERFPILTKEHKDATPQT